MSAYIMRDDEINTIVSYFISDVHGYGAWVRVGDDYDHLTDDNAAQVAKILMDENTRSVNHRYNDSSSNPYEFKKDRKAKSLPVGNIIGALDCLEYQSCETDDWKQSNAWEIITNLRKYLLVTMAEKDGTYTWGIK